MDQGYERIISDERLREYEADADRVRSLGWFRGPSARATRDARKIGLIVRKALSATARCRWSEVDRALVALEQQELRPVAQVAIRAVYAQARGDQEAADELCRRLRDVAVSRNADAHVWASGVIAAAFHGYLTGTIDDSIQPVALMRQMCSRLANLQPEIAEFMCLTLSLLARAGESPLLASFLLGHLTERLDAIDDSSSARGASLPRRRSAAVQAATGLCILTLGDSRVGARLLMNLMDGNDAGQMPLVTGLVGAELARLELEEGDRNAAARWIDRTHRFARRYESQLPVQIVARARSSLPAGR